MLERFAIVEYLEDCGIYFRQEGKNVSVGWVEIECPWCNDPSQHLGIRKESSGFNCWSCGQKGHITKLIARLEKISYKEASNKFKQYQQIKLPRREDGSFQKPPTLYALNKEPSSFFSLPKETSDKPSAHHIKYLTLRKFNYKKIQKLYKIKYCGIVGKFKHRIIIPIYHDHIVVSFTSRDVTGKAVSKYKHCSNELSMIPINQTVYNIDNCEGNTVIIVEGPLDVWRMGAHTCSLYGTQATLQQIALMKWKKFKKILILFDKNAKDKAEKLGYSLSTFCEHVALVDMKYQNGETIYEDPADMSDYDAQKTKDFLLNVYLNK